MFYLTTWHINKHINMNSKAIGNTRFLPKGLLILHEDRDLLVVHKPNGLLSIASGNPGIRNPGQKTAYSALTDYVKKGTAKSRNRIFIVHRLDRDTSGIIIFAKTPQAKNFLQDNWDKNTKKYLALVHGKMKENEETLSSYLTENKELRVYSTTDRQTGKLAETRYKVINTTKNISLLDIKLLTGRKNQIRVQLADAGNPVVGDKKYGLKDKKTASSRFLALHAYKLICKHPYSGKEMIFTSPPPAFFNKLTGGNGNIVPLD